MLQMYHFCLTSRGVSHFLILLYFNCITLLKDLHKQFPREINLCSVLRGRKSKKSLKSSEHSGRTSYNEYRLGMKASSPSLFAYNNLRRTSMPYTKTKSTKRFSFEINRNDTSHQAGANTVTISTNPDSGYYSAGTSAMTLTVKEAKALNMFLSTELAPAPVLDSSDSSVAIG